MNTYQSEPMGFVAIIVWLVLVVFFIAVGWKIFTKAGKPGWAAIVPIYNLVVVLEIVNRPIWWIVLTFIPVANFVVGIIIALDLAKSFGKGTGFGVGLILLAPVFSAILAFGDARYQGVARV